MDAPSAVASLPGESTVEAQRTGTVRHQHQEAARDRDVLEEVDHLDLVAEVVVEDESGQQGKTGEKDGDDASLPAANDGERAENLCRDVDWKQGGRNAEGGHVSGGPGVGAYLPHPGEQERNGQQDAGGELGNFLGGVHGSFLPL